MKKILSDYISDTMEEQSVEKHIGTWQNPWMSPFTISMAFAMEPWEKPLHGKTHTPWLLPWCMAFAICNGFYHWIPYSGLDSRCMLALLKLSDSIYRCSLYEAVAILIITQHCDCFCPLTHSDHCDTVNCIDSVRFWYLDFFNCQFVQNCFCNFCHLLLGDQLFPVGRIVLN